MNERNFFADVKRRNVYNNGFRLCEFAPACYMRGEREAADAPLAELVANDRHGLAHQIAPAYAVRGGKDKAFEWLQTAFSARHRLLDAFSRSVIARLAR